MPGEHDDNGRATLASLAAQVRAIDRDYQQLQRAVVGLDAKLDTSLNSLSSKFEAAIAGLSTKIDARATTPWQTIWTGVGVGVAILTALVTALYIPIRADTTRLDNAVSTIIDRGVYQRQYDADQSRLAREIAGLHDAYNGTILARRYDADQTRLTQLLDEIRRQTMSEHGRLSKLESHSDDTDKRLDAITRQIAEFIRDMGKH